MAPAGSYIDPPSVTPLSARLIWTTGYGIDHGSPILSYDIEGETTFEPGVWRMVATGTLRLKRPSIFFTDGYAIYELSRLQIWTMDKKC